MANAAHLVLLRGVSVVPCDDAPRASRRLDELDVEADNLRAALRALPCRIADGVDLGLTMAAGLGQYWRYRAVTEGAHWIDALLERRGGDDGIRGRGAVRQDLPRRRAG